MIANMDAWVRSDTAPPPSSYPRIADGNLVPLSAYALPAIPGVNRPHEANEGLRLDFGPRWQNGILSIQPPKAGKPFPVLVPQVDADGNERDGVRLPEYAAPLATYVGWNLRDPSIGAPDQRVAFEASYLPFPKPPPIGSNQAIRASPLRSATPTGTTIWPVIPTHSTNW